MSIRLVSVSALYDLIEKVGAVESPGFALLGMTTASTATDDHEQLDDWEGDLESALKHSTSSDVHWTYADSDTVFALIEHVSNESVWQIARVIRSQLGPALYPTHFAIAAILVQDNSCPPADLLSMLKTKLGDSLMPGSPSIEITHYQQDTTQTDCGS